MSILAFKKNQWEILQQRHESQSFNAGNSYHMKLFKHQKHILAMISAPEKIYGFAN